MSGPADARRIPQFLSILWVITNNLPIKDANKLENIPLGIPNKKKIKQSNYLVFLIAMAPSITPSNGSVTMLSAGSNTSQPSANAAVSGYQAFDHVLWYVGNAKQAASFYVVRMGFKHVAYVCIPVSFGDTSC